MVLTKDKIKVKTEATMETKTKVSFPAKIVRIHNTQQTDRMHIEIPAILREEVGNRWYFNNKIVKVTLEDI